MSKTTNSATKGVRMQHVPHHDVARGLPAQRAGPGQQVLVEVAAHFLEFAISRLPYAGVRAVVYAALTHAPASTMRGMLAIAASERAVPSSDPTDIAGLRRTQDKRLLPGDQIEQLLDAAHRRDQTALRAFRQRAQSTSTAGLPPSPTPGA